MHACVLGAFVFEENVRSVDFLVVKSAISSVIPVQQLWHDYMLSGADSSCVVYEVSQVVDKSSDIVPGNIVSATCTDNVFIVRRYILGNSGLDFLGAVSGVGMDIGVEASGTLVDLLISNH